MIYVILHFLPSLKHKFHGILLCVIITWGKPQLSSAIPGGGRHPPPSPSKMTFFVKMTSHWSLKSNEKKWKSSRYFTWNQCNYTSHTCLYPNMMNRGHGVAHRGAQNAQNVQKWQKLGNWAKNNEKKWKSFRYLTWNQCNYTSHTCLYPNMMNRGHGVADRGAQNAQNVQK